MSIPLQEVIDDHKQVCKTLACAEKVVDSLWVLWQVAGGKDKKTASEDFNRYAAFYNKGVATRESIETYARIKGFDLPDGDSYE